MEMKCFFATHHRRRMGFVLAFVVMTITQTVVESFISSNCASLSPPRCSTRAPCSRNKQTLIDTTAYRTIKSNNSSSKQHNKIITNVFNKDNDDNTDVADDEKTVVPINKNTVPGSSSSSDGVVEATTAALEEDNDNTSFLQNVWTSLTSPRRSSRPPMLIEDVDVLYYDIFLLVNLSLSISFWVVHRMSIEYIGTAVGEGSLLSICWVLSGLYNGAFLYSAVDNHKSDDDDDNFNSNNNGNDSSFSSGPKGAALLGLNTFIGASNLRIVFALLESVIEHRQVGLLSGEQLIPLEIGFGLVLMSMWRALHSANTPRI